ncbi:MAG TPA: ParB/RepB/Spo0J family partition protein [Bryobacteraceae bacterium]|jgi:ParB family chromosome partitioning protein|nr:ParB/RepB/Spo0J family partition protein [Bryobacteraceae bacterium]
MNKAPDKQRKVLGKGLSALLPTKSPSRQAEPQAPPIGTRVAVIPILQIEPNHLQPRTTFDPGRLQELANSIQTNGIIQPLIVRRKGADYELIAGERRLRAAKVAGLTEVPVVIQDYADDRLLEIALVENIQREDLNPIETAQALERLVREMHLSHEEIANRTGKDRTTITNMIRLLRLPADVQLLVAERRLSMGHARAILGLPTPELQTQMAEKSAAQGYSVRQVERLVKKISEPREPSEKPLQDPNIKAAIRELESTLGTRVRIVEKTDQHGRIEIEYYSQDDLQRVYEMILSTRKE